MDPGDTYYAFNWDFTRLYARPLVELREQGRHRGPEGSSRTSPRPSALPSPTATRPGPTSSRRASSTRTARPSRPRTSSTPSPAATTAGAHQRSEVLRAVPRRRVATRARTRTRTWTTSRASRRRTTTTIIFKLKQPFAEFDYLTVNPQTAPVPQAKDTGVKYQEHRALERALQVRELPGRQEVQPRQEHQWDAKTDPLRKQLADKIETTMKVDANDIDNRLLSGALDLALDGTGVQAADPGEDRSAATTSRRTLTTRSPASCATR